MERLLQDLRYGLRTLRNNPAFTFVAVLTLALGIGANTAIFSVVSAVLLRSLPYTEPERLVVVNETAGGKAMPVSYPNFLDWRDESQAFETLAAWVPDDLSLTGIDQAERIPAEIVSEDYFSLLGVSAAQGRTFLPDENRAPGGHPAAVISDGCWQRRFAGDPNMIGRTLKLNEMEFTVVGIMPASFEGFSGDAEVWVPMMMRAALYPQTARFNFLGSRDIHWHRVLGRLKPGATRGGAQAELDTITARLAAEYPQANEGRGARVAAAHETLVSNVRSPLLVLLGAVGFVLLIACANVANLLLVRAAARSREIAIRVALGAQRGRIIRQLLTESMVVAFLAGVAGLLLALWGVDLLVSILPLSLPRFAAIHINPGVVAFTTLVSLITGVMLGLVPAMHASKPNLNEVLKDGSKATGGPRGARVRRALVVAEVALALVLMIGAGLMLRSFQRMLASDPGFKPDHLVTLRFEVPNNSYQGELRAGVTQLLIERIEALPGVDSAAVTFIDPFKWSGINRGYTIEGRGPVPPAERDTVFYHNISPGYFRTMGIPFLTGRDFSVADRFGSQPVMIVSDSFARRYWPGENPLGKRLKFGPENSKAPWIAVVGVAGNMKFRTLRQDPSAEPVVYTPLLQTDVIISLSLVVRTKIEAASMISSLRSELRSFDPDVPVYSIATLEDRLRGEMTETRSYALLMGLFGALAMTLSAVGIYGVMAYAVAQRTHEIGLRMALGATTTDVLKLVVGQGMVLALGGIAAGLAAALALTRAMSSLLFDISPTDPLTLAVISVALAAVALGACFVPARRATKVDPMIALRYE